MTAREGTYINKLKTKVYNVKLFFRERSYGGFHSALDIGILTLEFFILRSKGGNVTVQS